VSPSDWREDGWRRRRPGPSATTLVSAWPKNQVAHEPVLALPLEAALRMSPSRWGRTAKETLVTS